MRNEQTPLTLDQLEVVRKAFQLPTGEIVECLKSNEGYWFYQVPALDEQGNELVDENDDAVLERVKIAA